MNNKKFKTELCENMELKGWCEYSENCRFAHNISELRCVNRHPKYKTTICKNFSLFKSCKYGRRCCFLHLEDLKSKNLSAGEFLNSENYSNENIEKRKKMPESLKNNYALIWSDEPLMYVGIKHRKYYQYSKHYKAPGEPVLKM